MVCHVDFSVWLCWTFLFLLPLIQCQSDSNGLRNSPFNDEIRRIPNENGVRRAVFGDGTLTNRLPPGIPPLQHRSYWRDGQTTPQQAQQKEDDKVSDGVNDTYEERTLVPAITVSTGLVALVTPAVPVAPSTKSTSPEPENPQTNSQNSVQESSTPTATITTTSSMTVIITPSPATALASGSPSLTNTATASPAITPAPLSTSPGTTMTPAARAGVGIGITFGILSIASAASFYLFRRRRNQRFQRDKRGGGLGGFFMLTRQRTSKDDTEWEIVDAEKVEIVRGAEARTVSRSDSRGTLPSRDGAGADGTKLPQVGLHIVKVGMRLPDRTHPALTSNPPMVSPSEFPTPPSTRGYEGGSENRGSWPLPVSPL